MSGTPNAQLDRRLTIGSQDTAGGAPGSAPAARDASMHSPVNVRGGGTWMLNKTSWQVSFVHVHSLLHCG